MCQRSKKCFTTGFPRSLHFFPRSSLIHLAIDMGLSEMKDLTIISEANKYAIASFKCHEFNSRAASSLVSPEIKLK